MTDTEILHEKTRSSDDTSGKATSNERKVEENFNEAENLDFYDFIEAVSEKIDKIENQSKINLKQTFPLIIFALL